MSLKNTFEEEFLKTERQLKEFSILLECLTIEYQKILESLDLTPEQLKAHIQNPYNFDPLTWQHMQEEKNKWDEKLKLEISLIPNPAKTRKTTMERGSIQQHWLYVR